MWILLLILGLILLAVLLLGLFLIRLHMHVAFLYDEDEQFIHTLVQLFGIPLYEKNLTLEEAEEDEGAQSDHLHRFSSVLKTIKTNVRRFEKMIRKTSIEELVWTTTAGTGDAALSGMAGGSIWAAKSMLLGQLMHTAIMKTNPKVNVQTDFQNRTFKTEMYCMGSIRLGQAIRAFLSVSGKESKHKAKKGGNQQ